MYTRPVSTILDNCVPQSIIQINNLLTLLSEEHGKQFKKTNICNLLPQPVNLWTHEVDSREKCYYFFMLKHGTLLQSSAIPEFSINRPQDKTVHIEKYMLFG